MKGDLSERRMRQRGQRKQRSVAQTIEGGSFHKQTLCRPDGPQAANK